MDHLNEFFQSRPLTILKRPGLGIATGHVDVQRHGVRLGVDSIGLRKEKRLPLGEIQNLKARVVRSWLMRGTRVMTRRRKLFVPRQKKYTTLRRVCLCQPG